MLNQSHLAPHFAEVFPVLQEALPLLACYRLIIQGKDQQVSAGRKLSDRFARMFEGYWVWTEDHLLTDARQEAATLQQALRTIQEKESETFKDISSIVVDDIWQLTAKAQADFVAQGLFSDLGEEFRKKLQPPIDLENAKVEREWEVSGWVVYGEPAVSISIESRVIFKDDLKTYFPKFASPDDAVGITVADKVYFEDGKAMKGEVEEICGKLDEDVDRSYLLGITQREGAKRYIQGAEKGEYVVRVRGYQYVVSELNIVLAPKDYKRFKINTKAAQNAVWIAASARNELIQKLSEVAQNRGYIGAAYTALKQKKSYFGSNKSYKYDPTILIGGGKPLEYNSKTLLNAIQKSGPYQRVSPVGTSNDAPLHVGFINASNINLDITQELLRKQLASLGLAHIEMTTQLASGTSRIPLERALRALRSSSPHIIVGIIPESDSHNEEDWGPYFEFKSLMMGENIPNQVIDSTTLSRNLQYILPNIALGMFSKMGNVPYILAHPLDYADIVVGIDIARQRRKKGGSQNAAALTQHYHQGGHFIRCNVVETSLEGETVPAKVLRSLFPLDQFENKRVIILRDGFFRGNEMDIIAAHLTEMDAQPQFIEVIKSGSPRLYKDNGEILSPDFGMAFYISDVEAFVITSESERAMPNPLHIRTFAPHKIGSALNCVTMLTMMHFGSLRRPRLPVPIHFSDKIGYLALRGVKPTSGQSTDMYWL